MFRSSGFLGSLTPKYAITRFTVWRLIVNYIKIIIINTLSMYGNKTKHVEEIKKTIYTI